MALLVLCGTVFHFVSVFYLVDKPLSHHSDITQYGKIHNHPILPLI